MSACAPTRRQQSLRRLLPEAKFLGAGDVQVSNCRQRADRCRPGDLYVAVVGPRHDGHDQVDLALRRGAAAVVAERILPVDVPQCIVPDSREAYARLCHALMDDPSAHLTTVGIAGTYGKTWVQWLLASIFGQANVECGLWGSLGRFDGQQAVRAPIEASGAGSLARWMHRCRERGRTHLLVESPSAMLGRRTFTDVQLDLAVVTQLLLDPRHARLPWVSPERTVDHLEGMLKSHGRVVLNADDPASAAWQARLGRSAITYGMNQPADVWGEVVEVQPGSQTMLLTWGDDTVAIESPIVGEHHLQNCLAAAAAALALGIEPADIARGLERVTTIPGRMERLDPCAPVAVYADAASTPRALSLTLSAVRRVTAGKLWCVVGSRWSDPVGRARLARIAERFSDHFVLTGSHLEKKASLESLHQMLDGVLQPARPHLLPDRVKAICFALQRAAPGDAVVLAGADVPSESAQGGQLTQGAVVRAWWEHACT